MYNKKKYVRYAFRHRILDPVVIAGNWQHNHVSHHHFISLLISIAISHRGWLKHVSTQWKITAVCATNVHAARANDDDSASSRCLTTSILTYSKIQSLKF